MATANGWTLAYPRNNGIKWEEVQREALELIAQRTGEITA